MVDNKEVSQVGTTLYMADSYLEISTYCHMIQEVMFFAGYPTMYQLKLVCIHLRGGYCFLQLREKVRSTMKKIVRKALNGEEEKADYILGKPTKPTKFDCYKLAVKSFSEKCFSFSKVCETRTHSIIHSSFVLFDYVRWTMPYAMCMLCQTSVRQEWIQKGM